MLTSKNQKIKLNLSQDFTERIGREQKSTWKIAVKLVAVLRKVPVKWMSVAG